MENNALDAALARRRSGPNSTKSSPMNSSNPRSPPPQPEQQSTYKTNFTNRRILETQSNSRKVPGQSKFCGECGTQFPVEWAKYCCLCGERRS